MIKLRSNGKFLITGEYLVLAGARAFATPLRLGQSMLIDENDNQGLLEWTVCDIDGFWFSAEYNLPDLSLINCSDPERAAFLKKSLEAAKKINPKFLSTKQGYWVDNLLEFNRNWGLGSSSSFLVNLAKWAEINPFDLHATISRGSGFDIAAAQTDQPFIYQRSFDNKSMELVKWNPPYKKQISFVYLGQKQNSEESIKSFPDLDYKDHQLDEIGLISEEIWMISSLDQFMEKLARHEEILELVLGRKTIQKKYFGDFPGVVKSLGAWGGDFVMVVSPNSPKKTKQYFKEKGYTTLLTWSDLIS